MKFLNEAEATSKRTGATQIVMDTPYRNQSTFLDLLNKLMPSTRLCIALGILEPGQFIQTKSIHTWCTQVPVLARVPAVFLFQA